MPGPLQPEISQPAYQQQGMQGFPQKFYNYHDLFRLYNLIAEGRASTLPEAYNLLEMQQFHETQVNLQEEANALQADIARSSRVSAVANVVTAYNTYCIHKRYVMSKKIKMKNLPRVLIENQSSRGGFLLSCKKVVRTASMYLSSLVLVKRIRNVVFARSNCVNVPKLADARKGT